MQKFIITSPAFTGQIEATYNSEGTLRQLDFREAQMPWLVLAEFKNKTPAHSENIAKGWNGLNAAVVEGEYTVSLDDFKHAYPYQRNMHLLPPIWDKMTMADKIVATEAAKPYSDYCKRNDKWYNPKIAASWLKEKQYLNNWQKL